VQPPAEWWKSLQDPQLDRLIDATLMANPGIDAARARLRRTRATLAQQHATLLPTTGASAAYLRARNIAGFFGGGPSTGGGDLNLYFVGLDATWELDLFGGHRRAVEGAAAATQASEASLADLLVSLTAEVAQAYIQLRDAQQRLALTQHNLEVEARVVELMKARHGGGTASELDVERVINQLDTLQATVAPLRALIAQQLDRIAVLTGHEPGALDQELSATAEPPSPPASVPIGDPAAMLRRRPDIAMAERKLAQQNAAIGENTAALFPKVTLLGDVGFAALNPATLFNGSNFTYVIAPMLQWTPWDFGRTRARIAQSSAARDEAEADYRRTVLAALDDAETSLALYGEQRSTVTDLARAKQSAERVYALTEIRLRGGTASTTDVLDADTRRVQAQLSYEQALAQLTQYYVALQKSLGLGFMQTPGG
jgi:NodT family efflux transporter outer membrane factor (OMF) lipoprotein